jgi:hypothetical protein
MAGSFYLLCIVTNIIELSGKDGHWLTVSSSLISTASFLTVTVLFYYLFKPVSARLSLVAMPFSLAGCTILFLRPLHLVPRHLHSPFFGFYLLLIGYLILRSTFLPHTLGALMAIAGLGLLTHVSRRLASQFSPYQYLAAGIAEGLLTVWLLAVGVNAVRWKEQAGLRALLSDRSLQRQLEA